jgi:hypothetical protein
VESLWEVKFVFLKGIHDLEKCSPRCFQKILNLARYKFSTAVVSKHLEHAI